MKSQYTFLWAFCALLGLSAPGLASPLITGATPLTITAGPSIVEISGSGFTPGAALIWDGVTMPTRFVGPDLIEARVPAQAIGSHRLAVRQPGSISTGPGLVVTVKQDPRYLHVSGTELVTASGAPVRLRGYNIGGWLTTEGWLTGSTGPNDRFALEDLEARFGTVVAGSLIEEWRDHWFTAADLDLLASWGINTIRVPLDYRVLVGPGSIDAAGHLHGVRLARDPTTGIVYPSGGRLDFHHLDWVVAEADRRGLYVVFDLHVWEGQESGPGADPYQQISCDCTGSAIEQRQAALLWTAIAAHFKGNGTIAGMDVINEPTGSPGDQVQHVLLDGVRAGDPNRVGIIEWVWYGAFARDWPNSVYSTHYPPEMTAAWAAANLPSGVPIFMGEIKAAADDAAAAQALGQSLDQFGFNWAVWTYKGVNDGGWAMFDYVPGTAAVDPTRDSAALIRRAWDQPLLAWQKTGHNVTSSLETGLIQGYRAAMTP